MHPVWLLRVLASTFLAQGVWSLWSMLVSYAAGDWAIFLGVFCIPVGLGLLKQYERARRWGVVFAGVTLGIAVYGILVLSLQLGWSVPSMNGQTFAERVAMHDLIALLFFEGLVSSLQLAGLRNLRSRMTFRKHDDQDEAESTAPRKASRSRLAFGWSVVLLLAVVIINLAINTS